MLAHVALSCLLAVAVAYPSKPLGTLAVAYPSKPLGTLAVAYPSKNTGPLNTCKLQLLNRRDVFQMSGSGEKLRITMKLVEDNRPCQLAVSSPGEIKPHLLTLHKEQQTSSSSGVTVKVKTLFKDMTVVKILVRQQGKQSLRGRYGINGFTIFGFPLSNEGVSEVKEVGCEDDKAKGNIEMTDDLKMCCEYHRSRNSTDEPVLGQCCNQCLLLPDDISVRIEYEKNNLEFVLGEGYNGKEAEIACVIQSEGVHEYKVRFKTTAAKAKC